MPLVQQLIQMATQHSYFFKNSNGYYYFRYVLPKKYQLTCPEKGKIKEIKFSIGTKCKRVAKLQTKYALRIIMNHINSGEFRMKFIEEFRKKESEAISYFKNKYPEYANQEIDLGLISKVTKNLKIEKGYEIGKQINFITSNGFSDDLKSVCNKEEFDILLQATQRIKEDEIKQKVNEKVQGIKRSRGDSLSFVTSVTSLTDLITRYSKEKDIAKSWRPKTKMENLSIYNRFIKETGVNNLDDLSIKKMRDFKEVLIDSKLNAKTINKYITRLEGLIEWAVSEGYLEKNPIKGIARIPITKTDNNRTALSISTLRSIFTSDYYINPRNNHTFDYTYQYWLPLIGLYTGARLNEICQLHVSDILEKDGALYFDINDNTPDKRLKTASSKRLVPIHETLIKLGFIAFIEGLKKTNTLRLFPDLKNDRDGYGHRASRWYSTYRKKLGISEYHVDFHSLRHTFITRCYDQGFATDDIQGIVGHEKHTITGEVYGRSADLSERHIKVIKAICYDIDSQNIVPFESYPFRNGRVKVKTK